MVAGALAAMRIRLAMHALVRLARGSLEFVGLGQDVSLVVRDWMLLWEKQVFLSGAEQFFGFLGPRVVV